MTPAGRLSVSRQVCGRDADGAALAVGVIGHIVMIHVVSVVECAVEHKTDPVSFDKHALVRLSEQRFR